MWKTPLEGRGASSPVTFGDRIYLTSYTGYGIDADNPGNPADLQRHLLCISLKDGKILWTKSVPAPSENNPFTTWAVALHGYASSTPAVDKTGIYVFFGAAGVLAFSHDGDQLWQTSVGTGTHDFGAGNSPVLYKDMVIVNASVECGDLIALRKSDGSEVWRQPDIAESWSTPAIYRNPAGAMELAVTIKEKVLAFNPDDGTPLWNCAGIPDYICPSIIAHDGTIFASGGRRSEMIAIRSGGKGDVTETNKSLGNRQRIECLVARVSRRVSVLGQGRRHRVLREGRHRRNRVRGATQARLGPRLRLAAVGGWEDLLCESSERNLRAARQARVQAAGTQQYGR